MSNEMIEKVANNNKLIDKILIDKIATVISNCNQRETYGEIRYPFPNNDKYYKNKYRNIAKAVLSIINEKT